MSIVKIARIGKITDGEKPQTGPDHSTPLVVEIDGGRDFLELPPNAARELADALNKVLKERGA